jgi:predicted metalloprotease with PDZ domain
MFLDLAARVLAAVATVPAPSAPVQYVVSLRHARTQMIEVDVSVAGVAPGTDHLDFIMPSWRPGRYVVLDFAGGVREVRADSGAEAGARALECEKTDKSTWRVRTDGSGTVTLHYRIYANSLGERTRHADDSHAFMDGAAVFMYADGHRQDPVRVRIDAPQDWSVASGLDFEPGSADTLTASSYDVLADAPIEAGLHDTMRFDVDGRPHEIVVWGRGHYDRDAMTRDFAKIVREEARVFGDMPYDRYVFLVHSYPGGSGGTEHLNSTIMQTSPATFDTPEGYRRFLGLASHEMFHTWNVKHLRPAGISPYDYTKENYCKLLWVAEGTTSYYGGLTLVRAGLTKPDDYLKGLGRSIDEFGKRPGRLVQSLEQSSFDAWISFNKPSPDSANSTVSFYDKGSLVSLMLDLRIRGATQGGASLDTVLRDLYQRFPLGGAGYTPEDLRAAAEQAAGLDLREFFERYVRGTAELEWPDLVAGVGLELVRGEGTTPRRRSTDAESEDAGSPIETSEAKEPKSALGLTLKDEGGLAVVSAVASDGPAYAAGIIAGDTILAIDGVRLKATELEARLKKVKPGQSVRVSYFRYDQLRDLELPAAAAPSGDRKLRRVAEPTDEQRAAYASWLGQPWPDKPANGAKDDESKERP